MANGFLKVKGNNKTLALGSGGQLSKIDLSRPMLPWEKRLSQEADKLKNGVYRITTRNVGGRGTYTLSSERLDAKKAAQEIEGRERKGFATTGSPGITGFQKASNASSAAARNKQREAEAFVKWLREGRDYKDEYKKFQSSPAKKKYRAELNKYNRQKGTYGNGDGQDASHKGGKISGTEPQSKNRGRAEKSRKKGSTRKSEGVLKMMPLVDSILEGGEIDTMYLTKFYSVATPEQGIELERLIDKQNFAGAKKLIDRVTADNTIAFQAPGQGLRASRKGAV